MIDVFLWYVWAQGFALAGSLIASHCWLSKLSDCGYGVGKALGILLGGFVYWFVVTFGFSQNNVGAVLLALAAVWTAGIALRAISQKRRVLNRESFTFIPCTSTIIITELLFAFGFVAWAVVRAYSPNIDSAGGEKFMESMMINAILRSPTFPPNDAWLSGFPISYYYFGYVIYAMLIRVSGVAPSVGFNLGGALIFALTLTSAFSIGFNLWGKRILDSSDSSDAPKARISGDPWNEERDRGQNPKLAITAGLITASILALMGNMGGLMGALKCVNALPQSVWQWLDIRNTATDTYTCRGLAPDTFYSWWWDWSRVVKDTDLAGAYQEVITEAPIFSFVLGDNHPHVMALPFVLVALGLALTVFDDGPFDPSASSRLRAGWAKDHSHPSFVIRCLPDLILSAIVLGGLSFMNTWDFPVYATLFVGALVLGRWLRHESLWPAVIYGVSVIALGYLLYIPFYATFSSQARGIAVNLFNGTRLSQFTMMFAPFLVAGLGFLLVMAHEVSVPAVRIASRAAGLAVGLLLIVIAGLVVLGSLSSETRAMAQELQATGQVLGFTREQMNQRLLERVTDSRLILVLGGGAVLCTVLVLSSRRTISKAEAEIDNFVITPSPVQLPNHVSRSDEYDEKRVPKMVIPSSDVFALMLFGAGALLTLSVEFVFLRDLFGTRMNTLFKFYYIGWALWSVASGYAIMRLLTTKGALAKAFGIAAATLVGAGLLWPAMAVPARTYNFTSTPTLDGMAYIRQQHLDDGAMIDWLNTTVVGDPHIVETPLLGSYNYQGRISTFTGLPAALGWAFHEQQWRGDITVAAERNLQVTNLYSTTDKLEARTLLNILSARYVIVGDTERGQFAVESLEKFQAICSTAFQSGNSIIYDCSR